MRTFKNAVVCIMVGVFVAIASCSAINLTKRNIEIQKKPVDTPYIVPMELTPAMVPALNKLPSISKHQRPDFKPFKDSLINGLKTIKDAVDLNNRMLDTGLNNQGKYMLKQAEVYNRVVQLQDQVNGLQLDTSKLYSRLKFTTIVTNDVKQDAQSWNAFRSLALGLLLFIAVGIAIIMIGIFILNSKLTKTPKYSNG